MVDKITLSACLLLSSCLFLDGKFLAAGEVTNVETENQDEKAPVCQKVKKILFCCHGNICRSTMSQFVFQDMVNKLELSGQFIIDSRATSKEEIGKPPHNGTVMKMQEVGIPIISHEATQITWDDYYNFDYIIGMDQKNMTNLNKMFNNDPDKKIYKFLTFAGSNDDIADPWYTGDFDVTYIDVVKGCEGLLKHLRDRGEI